MNLAYNGYKSFDIRNLCDPELKSHLRNYQEINIALRSKFIILIFPLFKSKYNFKMTSALLPDCFVPNGI